jgi:hypothetical protein
MSIVILYTTTEAIRAAVGVAATEVSDDALVDQALEDQLLSDLYHWIPDHASLYGVDSTAQEKQTTRLLEMYCMYFGAIRVIEMVLILRQSVTDGKQAVARFKVDWELLMSQFKARLGEIRAELEDITGVTYNSTGFFGVASPDYDPVTNT